MVEKANNAMPMVTSQPPAEPRIVSKAAIVTSEPVRSSPAAFVVPSTPEEAIASPVMVHTTIVSGHVYVALTYRIISGCCGCCDCSGTHTSFIGEDTTCNTESHGIHHGSNDGTAKSAAHCFYGESHFEDHGQTGRQVGNISNDYDQTADNVKDCHGRNNNSGNFGDRFDSAYNDDQG